MGLRDLIFSRLVRGHEDYERYFPSPDAWDIVRRQDELEMKLEERRRRRDMVRAQVEGLRGSA